MKENPLERTAGTINPNVDWYRSTEYNHVKEEYYKWFDSLSPEQRKAYELSGWSRILCDFFKDRYQELNLSDRGRSEIDEIWEDAAQYLEGEPIRRLVHLALIMWPAEDEKHN